MSQRLQPDYTGQRIPENERAYFKSKVVRLPPQKPSPPDSDEPEQTSSPPPARGPIPSTASGEPDVPRHRIVGHNFSMTQPIELVVRVLEAWERSVVNDSGPSI